MLYYKRDPLSIVSHRMPHAVRSPTVGTLRDTITKHLTRIFIRIDFLHF